MSGAYRESAAVTRVPLREIAWRRRVGWGAGWLVVFLVLGRTLWFVCAILRAPHAVLAAADLLGQLAVLAATWMLTAPRPDERAGRLAWALRASVVVTAVVVTLFRFWPVLRPLLIGSGVAVDVTGLLYVARLFGVFDKPRAATQARVLAALGPPLRLAIDILVANKLARSIIGLPFLVWFVWVFVLLLRLRRAARVVTHSWWLDDAAAAPRQWVSVLVLKDKHVEVISVDGGLGAFGSESEANAWLEAHGYVRSQNALDKGLVPVLPPALLPAKS